MLLDVAFGSNKAGPSLWQSIGAGEGGGQCRTGFQPVPDGSNANGGHLTACADCNRAGHPDFVRLGCIRDRLEAYPTLAAAPCEFIARKRSRQGDAPPNMTT